MIPSIFKKKISILKTLNPKVLFSCLSAFLFLMRCLEYFSFSTPPKISQDNLIFICCCSVPRSLIFWPSHHIYIFLELISLSVYFLLALFWGWCLFSALIFISLLPQKSSRLWKFIFWKVNICWVLFAGVVLVLWSRRE